MRKHPCVNAAFAVLTVCLSAAGAYAADLSESPGVDSFSSDFQNPTPFRLELGSNTIEGEVGAPGTGTLLADGSDGGTDGDYFTVVVPEGLRLDQIFVNRYNQLQRGFAAYAPGAAFDPPVAQGPNTFYPFSDGALFVGSGDIVPLPPEPLFIGSDAPADPSDSGFNVDFWPAGNYALLIQENQVGATEFQLEFLVSVVPEPAGLVLLGLGSLIGAGGARRRRRASCAGIVACLLTCCWGSSTSAQTLVNDLGGALTYEGVVSVPGQVAQIAFAPGDDAHAYVATFGGGVVRYDYDPAATNFLSNPLTAVPSPISSQGGVDGSLGIAFYEDATHGLTMFIAPAVPFTGAGGINNLHHQSIVRLTDDNGDGIFGNHASDVNQPIVNNVAVSQVHQINQLQVRGDTLFAAIGIRTQNGGQTAAQNQAIGGSGVDQSNPGETAYTGTVSFIEDLTLLAGDTSTANVAGFTVSDLNGDATIDDLDDRADAQPFSSTDPRKLRVYATGFRNNFGVDVDDSGEMWVSYNENENPNAEDELHRMVTFQSDHEFFKGNDMVGDWKVSGDEHPSLTQNSSQIALDAGYFDNANTVSPFALVGFNTAAGGLDFFGSETVDISLRGDVLLSRNSGAGQDVLYVDEETGSTSVVLEGLGGALEVERDPFGNFLAGGTGRIALIDVLSTSDPSNILGDFNGDFLVNVADWNLLKPEFGADTSGLTPGEARLAGDLDVSGLVDFEDLRIFADIFDDVNGSGSFAAWASRVPEPQSLLVAVAWGGLVTIFKGRRIRHIG